MPATTDPRAGINYGFTQGESGWGDDMDANLLKLAQAGFHLSVIDRDLTAPPGSPANGDTYIPAATATGAWTGWEGRIAIYRINAWVSYVPRKGWMAFIEDEDKIAVYKTGTTWSAGVAI